MKSLYRCRLVIVCLLSAFSTATVVITGHYSSSTATLLLAATTGYLLSQDIFLFTNILSNLTRRKSPLGFRAKRSTRKIFFHHVLAPTVRGCILIVISALLVYFSSTASDMTKRLASRVAGSCVIVLTLLLLTSNACQRPYVLGLLRNPLYPWRSENVEKFKSWRKKLSYFSLPRRVVLMYG